MIMMWLQSGWLEMQDLIPGRFVPLPLHPEYQWVWSWPLIFHLVLRLRNNGVVPPQGDQCSGGLAVAVICFALRRSVTVRQSWTFLRLPQHLLHVWNREVLAVVAVITLWHFDISVSIVCVFCQYCSDQSSQSGGYNSCFMLYLPECKMILI